MQRREWSIRVDDMIAAIDAAALAPAAAELGRELNPVILSAEEFAAKRREGDHFITSVLTDRRIWVIGDEAELAAAS